MRDFEREVRAPYLPIALVRAVTRPAAWLARRWGLDARYRRLRLPGPGSARTVGDDLTSTPRHEQL
jgi:hypothetical protein